MRLPFTRRSASADSPSAVRLVLGIGNPGREYERTRHNLGYLVVEALAAESGIAMRRRKFHSLCGEGNAGGQRLVLLKPLTYVNLSGLAAAAALRHFKSGPAQMLVVCDDLNLPTGKLRVRRGGSAGGHHGLESIAEKLGSQDFPRVRIGIDRPAERAGDRGPVTGHVLSRFTPEESALIADAMGRATEAVNCWVREGIEVAMNRYN